MFNMRPNDGGLAASLFAGGPLEVTGGLDTGLQSSRAASTKSPADGALGGEAFSCGEGIGDASPPATRFPDRPKKHDTPHSSSNALHFIKRLALRPRLQGVLQRLHGVRTRALNEHAPSLGYRTIPVSHHSDEPPGIRP